MGTTELSHLIGCMMKIAVLPAHAACCELVDLRFAIFCMQPSMYMPLRTKTLTFQLTKTKCIQKTTIVKLFGPIGLNRSIHVNDLTIHEAYWKYKISYHCGDIQ